MDKVSIIVPVYNVSRYLRSCIESVINQSYRCIELLLIDDGSSDGSEKICDEYMRKDNRIHVFHQSNHGVTFARKIGVENSTGTWILFLDGDDNLSLNAVEFFIETAKTYNVDMVISPEVKCFDMRMKKSRFYFEGKINKNQFMKFISLQYFNCGIGGKFWAKKLYYDGVLDASNKIKNNEDYLMNLRLAERMESAFCDAHNAVYIVNVREGSASRTRLLKENWFVLYDELIRISKGLGDYPLFFLISSLEQRLKGHEISRKDVFMYASKIQLYKSAPFYLRLMHKWMISDNIIFLVISKILRCLYRIYHLSKIYSK